MLTLIGCLLKDSNPKWGISSDGRAPALQAGGRRFDPVILHQRPWVCLYFVRVSRAKYQLPEKVGFYF